MLGWVTAQETRVAAPLKLMDYMLGMELAAVAWTGAILVFLAVYGPILFRPRVAKA